MRWNPRKSPEPRLAGFGETVPRFTSRVTMAFALVAALLSGCVTTRVEESKHAATGIEDHESVVVLATSYHRGNKTEDGFLDCVSESLDNGRDSLRVYPREQFLDELFPWFEPRTMPVAVESLPELFARPGVAEKLTRDGIRYLVWVEGATERTSGGGGLSCGAAGFAAACFGLTWWENDGTYAATVWDLRRSTFAGQVSTAVHGTSMIPAVIVPVPLIARTQTAACKGLVRELQEFISQEGPS